MLLEKVYIAGPMTGYEGFNYETFNQMERLLKGNEGVSCHNPASQGTVEGWTWSDYLKAGVAAIPSCDTILLLPGYKDSAGAQVELLVARMLGLKEVEVFRDKLFVLPLSQWTVRADFRKVERVPSFRVPGTPSAKQMAMVCSFHRILRDIISVNSEAHGGDVEWLARTPQFHLQKVAGHAVTAMAQLDLHKSSPDANGETPADHVARSLVRSAMAASVMGL